jgi:uncharacterized protein (TIGR00156 family)
MKMRHWLRGDRLGFGLGVLLLAACASTTPTSISIAQATATPDNSKVVVTARLVQQLDSNHYLLQDDSGQITAVIDRDLLGKVKLAPNAHLRIFGVIDQDRQPPLLEAKTVQVVE